MGGAESGISLEGDMNDILRQDLISLINRATSDQLYIALQSPKSRIRNQFIRFLAVSFANWTAAQPNTSTKEDEVKNAWKQSLTIQKNGIKAHGIDNIPTTTLASSGESVSIFPTIFVYIFDSLSLSLCFHFKI